MDSSKSLDPVPRERRHFLHRFSDSALHTGLMAAVIALVLLALAQAISMGVAVWRLDPVLVQGSSVKR